ncbi:diphthamide biosynthesis protein 2 [Phialemonium atrogriseum]|uniref:2-(3-amino-3-carboxypropyl)histidine synthase subunit 2 n=1 Tax=Phialemonium atrogriseum TaxID=1093897 RepID=A0AAJ0BZC5_9PEZI|nr:diphthamide biosynthesis protein 2 [Phialemonium atrogriseum]KAK1767259.1 diphthamide biosynthesis protein 2 [Phialemonium atrogriseum]
MANNLSAPPALSTPAEHLFERIKPNVAPADNEAQARTRSEDELRDTYEIARTAKEIRGGRRRRIALQFPDSMLRHAPWVVEALKAELDTLGYDETPGNTTEAPRGAADPNQERIYILADTSYSACCVDEIAAEHVDADVVVHYGRACLSPTSRLPVVHVFTKHRLDEQAVLEAFEQTFDDKQSKVVLMADVTYHDHVPGLAARIRADRGYANLLSTGICHNPLGRIPNRLILDPEGADISADVDLKDYAVFHISSPPTALLLALSSRVKSLHILPTPTTSPSPSDPRPTAPAPSATQTAAQLLGRRYARVLTLATAGVVGILVNTLSVSDYLPAVDGVRRLVAAAGKKSYTVVVGRLNPAKLANFAEVDGWVVVGCWEGSLVEDDGDYFRPVVTPFELGAALVGDGKRVWDGAWWGGIEGPRGVLGGEETGEEEEVAREADGAGEEVVEEDGRDWEGGVDEEESEPPEFDLRTGKLVSRSRPMRMISHNQGRGAGVGEAEAEAGTRSSDALALRPKSDLATVKGVVSPGAEFLRSQRTWQGLGTDFDSSETSTAIEEGRSGVARGYTVGENHERT